MENGRLRIWLSDAELKQWGICYERLGESRIETDRLLRRILSAARQCGGLRRHLSVEAFPVAGGCILLVCDDDSIHPGGPLVCRIPRLEELYALAECWRASGEPAPVSTLYEWNEEYLLVLYPVPSFTAGQQAMLREYSQSISYGDAAAAMAAEHGRLLAAGHALERLTVTGDACQPPAVPDSTP